MLTQVLDEIRSAIRFARHRPLFTLAAITTLAAAIAVATTAFGLTRAILWQALPFDDATRLVFLWEEVERDGRRHPARVTGARFALWRESDSGLSAISLFGAAGFTADFGEGVTSIRGVRVSTNYFETLGVRPTLGRTFLPHEEVPGNHRVIVLSHALWVERLGRRADILGTTLRLSGDNYTIVGVMPPVTFPAWPVNPATVLLDADARQFWVPIARTPQLEQSDAAHVFGVVGRLAPGVTAAHAAERLNATAAASAVDAHGARPEPLREQFVRDARTPLLVLSGAALVVLLIACANLAALFVSAFESRRTELAVRAAVGASLPRLVRQLMLEALLLAVGGLAAGIALARMALIVIPRRLPASIPLLTAPGLDLPVASFAAALAWLAALMFTAWPVARLVSAPPVPRGAGAPAGVLVYRVLVVAQVALTSALAVAAALLAQSLESVERRHPGFTIDGVLVAELGLPAAVSASPAHLARLERDLLASVAARPQVTSAAVAYDHPLEANWSEAPAVAGDVGAGDTRRQTELRIVSPGYFDALGVAVLEGRAFTGDDTFERPGVALVNEAFAREIGGAVLGRRLQSGTPRFTFGPAAPGEFEIIGVVANERFRGLEQPTPPAFYLSTRQFPQQGLTLLVRTSGDPLAAAADVRASIRALDSRITFSRPTSLEGILGEQLVTRRVTSDVIGGFTVAALALAGLGLYALLAVMVGRRAREIGVRLAIGASPGSVARQIVGDSLRTALTGILFGSALALLAGRLVQALLVGVSPRDPLTLVAVASVLLTIAACAALAPARRAARIDPIVVLKAE